MSAPTLAFDLETGGHHPGYLLHWARRVEAVAPGSTLVLGVSEDFARLHPDIAGEVGQMRHVRLRAVEPVQAPARSALARMAPGPAVAALDEWWTLCRAAREVGAGHVVAMYIDRLLQVPLALGLRAPCPVSGIYFRPTFHYGDLAGAAPLAVSERLRARRQRLLVRRALNHRRLHTLFCLDRFAAEALGGPARPLADPVAVYDLPDDAGARCRERLGVEAGRTVFLLFGVIGPRKGAIEVLQALRALSPDVAASVAVILAGPVERGAADVLRDAIDGLRAGPVQIVQDDRFIREHEIQPYFEAADAVLAPYPRHVGMSAILVRAAAAGRPVIGPTYGLMGALIQRYRLGQAVDATDPGAIAAAMTRCVAGEARGDRASMTRFAAENTAQGFGDALIERTMGS